MHYVYLIKSEKDSQLYLGCTADLRKRLLAHNTGRVPSTKNRGPFSPIYYAAYASKDDAFKREHNLKLRANALGQLKRRLAKSLNTN